MEDAYDSSYGVASLVVVLVLIGTTISFERAKEAIFHKADVRYQTVVEKLFGELSVLGFLSLCTFCVSQTNFFESLNNYGLEGEQVLEMVELTHFILFFVVLKFVMNVTVLIGQAKSIEQQWNEFQLTSQSLKPNEMRVAPPQTFKTRNWFLRSIRPDLAKEELFVRFCSLKEEFILDRDLNPPFAPANEDERLDQDFNYGSYLSKCLAKTLEDIVEIHEPTWFVFAIFSIVFYITYMYVLQENDLILAWLWIGTNCLANVLNGLFYRHLTNVTIKLGARPIDPVTLSETNDISDKEECLLDESQLPLWCDIPLDESDKHLNRQQKLFLFQQRGPRTYQIMLQVNLVFSALYVARLVISYFPFMYQEQTLVHFIFYVILSIIPGVIALHQWISVASVLTQVISMGYLRRPAVVAVVVREQKIKAMIRAFLLVHRVKTFVEDCEHDQTLSDSQKVIPMFRHCRHAELAFKAIDGNGDGNLDAKEFESLMTSLGMPVNNVMVEKIIKTLDMDGDGVVDLQEFLVFYNSIMKSSPGCPTTPKSLAADLFSIFDIDNDGDVTPNEFVKTLSAFHLGFTIEDTGELLKELDSDGSGSISLEKFEALVARHFPEELGAQEDTDSSHES